ncbi:hypothetical protein [Actibacterium ureilyticum]|uniref:hypothetical protein n=1 Tax=Actibacterium ureilyticum TaxID=1590614 RepID=UPI000BAAEE18|nr:hypothetical protein [Actibacterium ureilyticum]
MTRKDRKMEDDDAFDRALTALLTPERDTDTAEMSRAVLSRIAARTTPRRAPLAEVLTAPAPLGAGFAVLLLAAAGVGYALVPGWDDPMGLLMIGDLLVTGGL